MCETVGIFCIQPDIAEQIIYSLLLFFLGQLKMNIHPFGDNLSNGHTGIQGGIRILKDYLCILTESKQLLAL